MSWPRHVCPFGTPDDAPPTDTIVLAAVGHALRQMTSDMLTADLPEAFMVQLCRLHRRELAERACALVARPLIAEVLESEAPALVAAVGPGPLAAAAA